MGVNPELAERVRTAATDEAVRRGFEIREKHMFGGLAFMLNNKMACGVIDDELMVRVGPDAYEAALTKPHARPMDFTGRPMVGCVFVEPSGIRSDAALRQWLTRARRFVEALPPKKLTSAARKAFRGGRQARRATR